MVTGVCVPVHKSVVIWIGSDGVVVVRVFSLGESKMMFASGTRLFPHSWIVSHCVIDCSG